ncbi:membrane protein [Reticulibacter mediterranei]|uniref:Membrane protein n=1 Tax=Reticulibacter mediterranei TaxID=2778369 RepID=A0A8J3INB7_9CHLR|nr:DUF4126 domain-containing protein [Reticulibacter mediterranei]GHO97721.1 membrane protein [Reticulibacter mediterranei]
MELGTPLGLGFASGLNAYLPLLSFAVAARWLHWYHVNASFAFLTSDWCIVALLVLTLADFLVDKIPGVDHAWDATHTVVRPLAGALVAAASSGSVTIPIHMSAVSTYHQIGSIFADVQVVGYGVLIIAVLGGILAAMSHAAKAATRFVSTITTAGLLNMVLSLSEDILVVLAILLSLFIPVVMLVLIALFLLVFGRPVLFLWRQRLNRSRSLL